jgi:hypothetical protein
MALPLFEQQLHDVDFRRCGLGQRDPVRFRRTGRGLSNSQTRALANWNNVRNGPVAIMDRHRLSALDDPEEFAQPRFQLGNANLLHDYM